MINPKRKLVYSFLCVAFAWSLLNVNSNANQSPPTRHNNIEVLSSSNATVGENKTDYLVGYICAGKTIKRAVVSANTAYGFSASHLKRIEGKLSDSFCANARIFTFQKLLDQ